MRPPAFLLILLLVSCAEKKKALPFTEKEFFAGIENLFEKSVTPGEKELIIYRAKSGEELFEILSHDGRILSLTLALMKKDLYNEHAASTRAMLSHFLTRGAGEFKMAAAQITALLDKNAKKEYRDGEFESAKNGLKLRTRFSARSGLLVVSLTAE